MIVSTISALWWPNQDYYDLSWERVKMPCSTPAMRKALFKIWLDRDYTGIWSSGQ